MSAGREAAPQGSTARRIWGLMYRHLALYRRSWPRLFELMYWPVLQMVVWGFVTAYLAGLQSGPASIAAGVLLSIYVARDESRQYRALERLRNAAG